MKIIINADDFGISSSVNVAITSVMIDKKCCNTTLLVNMPTTEEAVSLSKENGFYDKVGLHLNLTQGFPLTKDIRSQKKFCDNNGMFNSVFHRGIGKFYLNRAEKRAVNIEIRAQIEKYLSYGLLLKHLDGHHHVHTNYSVYKILIPIIKEYDFKSVRLSRNMYSFKEMPFLKIIYKKLLNNSISALVNSTDFMGSIQDFIDFKNKIPKKSMVEIMVHPIFRNSTIFDSKIKFDFVNDALMGFELISYRDLNNLLN
jgi:hypothetical protein